MQTLRRPWLIGVLLALEACALPAEYDSYPTFTQLEKTVPLASDRGRVVFYRQWEGGNTPDYSVDDLELGDLVRQYSFLFVDVPSGEYEITSKALLTLTNRSNITLDPGETVFFRTMGTHRLVRIDPQQARKEIAITRYKLADLPES